MKSVHAEPRGMVSPASAGGGDLGTFDFLALLRRHTWLIIATIFLGTTTSVILAFSLEERYTASSTLVFERVNSRVSMTGGKLEGEEVTKADIDEELAFLKSRVFVGQLADSLDLVDDPFFNPYIPNREPRWGQAYMQKVSRIVASYIPHGAATRKSPPATAIQREKAITNLISNVMLRQYPGSLEVSIRVEHPDPERAAFLANSIAESYVKYSLERKIESIDSVISRLKKRTGQLAAHIAEIEQKIVNHIRDYQLDVGGRDNRRNEILHAELAKLRAQLALLEKAPPSNVSSISTEQTELLKSKIAGVEKELEELTMTEIQRRALEQELVTNRDRYNQLVEQLMELDSQAENQAPGVRIVSRASVPLQPTYPKRKMIIASGFIGSAMLSALLALLLDGLFTRIRSEQRAMQLTGLLSLAIIPEATGRAGLKIKQPIKYLKENSGSFFAEAMRSLYSVTRYSKEGCEPKILMFTSALPDEGKSTLALGLAITAARLGLKVIVVDLDLHRCGVSKMIGAISKDVDLGNYLEGNGELSDIIRSDPEVPGLHMIAAAPGEVPPSALLSTRRLSEMLAGLRQDYDLVIIDTPAILILNDAALLAESVDAAILVIRWGETTERALMDATARLRINHIPLIGTVLNRVKLRAHARYGGAGMAYYKQAKNYYSNTGKAANR